MTLGLTFVNGGPPFLNADNLNAVVSAINDAASVPDAALAARVVTGATATALNATYANIPAGIADGQVPVWQASTSKFVPGSGGGSGSANQAAALSIVLGG